jgi:hypothetical protein
MMVFGVIQKLSPSFDIKLAFHQNCVYACVHNNVDLEDTVYVGRDLTYGSGGASLNRKGGTSLRAPQKNISNAAKAA